MLETLCSSQLLSSWNRRLKVEIESDEERDEAGSFPFQAEDTQHSPPLGNRAVGTDWVLTWCFGMKGKPEK